MLSEQPPEPPADPMYWLRAQTEELRRQSDLLQRMSRHTALLYGVTVAWLVLLALGFIVALVELSESGGF
ncbi:hypothetical protein [Blastococcus sp. SYSU D00820]